MAGRADGVGAGGLVWELGCRCVRGGMDGSVRVGAAGRCGHLG